MSSYHTPIEKDFFLWGVASSGYQHEGGYNSDRSPLNNWYHWEKEKKISPTGKSADFWNQYEQDFKLAQKIGLNSFRLSIEWARVQPMTEPLDLYGGPPPFDQQAIDHYAQILFAARQHGLEPIITLLHFTHPIWLGNDPWLDSKTPALFANYTKTLIENLNEKLISKGEKPLRWFLTINEPNMLTTNTYLAHSHPSGSPIGIRAILKATQNLLIAHLLAYRQIHQVYQENPSWGKPMVTLNNYASDLYWLDKFLMDALSAPSFGVQRKNFFQWISAKRRDFNIRFKQARIPLQGGFSRWLGIFIKWLHHQIGEKYAADRHFNKFLDILYQEPRQCSLDYLAFDYYDPFISHAFRFPRPIDFLRPRLDFRDWLLESMKVKEWEWKVLPQGLRFFVETYTNDFPDKNIVIAENGIAFRKNQQDKQPWRKDNLTRSEFLNKHLSEINRLKKEGKPIKGYFHWSLTDNYEWGSYMPRFGLYHIDFSSNDRVRQQLPDHPEQTYAQLIQNSKNAA